MPLHGLLDEGKITLPGNSETVIAHPDFEMHLTQNPLAYHGTKAQNQAFLDRFRVVRMDYDPEIDAALIQQLGVSENVQIAMNNFIQAVRKLFDSGLITQPFGHRTLDTIVLNHSVFSLSECVQMAFLNKLCDTDRLAIKRAWDDLVNCEGGNVDASK
jgi:MoxR-like ATPase